MTFVSCLLLGALLFGAGCLAETGGPATQTGDGDPLDHANGDLDATQASDVGGAAAELKYGLGWRGLACFYCGMDRLVGLESCACQICRTGSDCGGRCRELGYESDDCKALKAPELQ